MFEELRQVVVTGHSLPSLLCRACFREVFLQDKFLVSERMLLW